MMRSLPVADPGGASAIEIAAIRVKAGLCSVVCVPHRRSDAVILTGSNSTSLACLPVAREFPSSRRAATTRLQRPCRSICRSFSCLLEMELQFGRKLLLLAAPPGQPTNFRKNEVIAPPLKTPPKGPLKNSPVSRRCCPKLASGAPSTCRPVKAKG